MADFYEQATAQRQAQIAADHAECLADLARARAANDSDFAAQSVQRLANLQAEQQNLQRLYADYHRSQNPPPPPEPTPEERAARPWQAMTPDDALELVRESKYGKDLTHDDLAAGYREVAARRQRGQ